MSESGVRVCPDCGMPRPRIVSRTTPAVTHLVRSVWVWADCHYCRLFNSYPEGDLDSMVDKAAEQAGLYGEGADR